MAATKKKAAKKPTKPLAVVTTQMKHVTMNRGFGSRRANLSITETAAGGYDLRYTRGGCWRPTGVTTAELGALRTLLQLHVNGKHVMDGWKEFMQAKGLGHLIDVIEVPDLYTSTLLKLGNDTIHVSDPTVKGRLVRLSRNDYGYSDETTHLSRSETIALVDLITAALGDGTEGEPEE